MLQTHLRRTLLRGVADSGSRQSPRESSTPTEGIPDALLFFTEYLSLTRYFSCQTTKKAGLPIFLMGSFGSPLRFNLELKLNSRFLGAGTRPAPAKSNFQWATIFNGRPGYPLDLFRQTIARDGVKG